MAKAVAVPELECGCGAKVPIPGRRIGDSVPCPSCRKLLVVLRSRVTGDVLPAAGAPGQISDRLPEVQESLERIRMRRAGHGARDVALYPLGAVFGVGAFGWYLSSILQGQNLVALGFPREGRRLQVLGIVSYVVIATILLFATVRFDAQVPGGTMTLLVVALACFVAGPLACTLVGVKHVRAAFDAGAQPASAILTTLLGFLLAVAQLFVFKFVDLVSGW